VDEIAANIITHGYAEAGLTGAIEMYVQVDSSALTIILEDSAPPYTPNFDQPPSSLDLPPEERPLGGLGLYLAAQNVDQLSYTRLGGRNRHTVVVNRPRSE
jgi:serine/threonine-protein kinase RsbW